MKAFLLLTGLGLPMIAIASPTPVPTQRVAAPANEYNVVNVEGMKRHVQEPQVQRSGERSYYQDVYNCPPKDNYRCQVSPTTTNGGGSGWVQPNR
ncbi:MAG: hypothetical protein AB7N80_11625 [Bdellovibrionales bacterium]